MNFHTILTILGGLLTILALSMCFPLTVDALQQNPDWKVFATSAAATGFFGMALVLANYGRLGNIDIRDSFAMTVIAWAALPAFASLPFIFGDLGLSLADAYFESMSGLTTTGSTVVIGLDGLPPGILLWRAILQWIGGIGVIVMAISVLPLMRVGGMQLFKVEAFDTTVSDRAGALSISTTITLIYLAMTVACGLALHSAGLSALESTVHAMTAIATGGFSTSDRSIGHFDSALVDAITTVAMLSGGIPFLLYAKAIRGKVRPLVRDRQVQAYLALLLASTAIMTLWLHVANAETYAHGLRMASFTVTSIMTGTGFVSSDYSMWGPFPIGVLFFLTFVGGCAGSTSCGMKVFRFQVLFIASYRILRKMIYPHGVFISRFNGIVLSEDVITSVLGFVFLFGMTYALLAIGLMGTGLDFVTALSSAATAVANVGPGLGKIVGPAGTFHDLPDSAKWILSGGMMMGRLEIYSVLVIFMPAFWRR